MLTCQTDQTEKQPKIAVYLNKSTFHENIHNYFSIFSKFDRIPSNVLLQRIKEKYLWLVVL